MCINRLPLNRDVQDIIKSYTLYDMKTAEILKKVKTQKKEIVYLFENAAVSRKNDGLQDFEAEPSDLDSEHWVFWLGGNENQFQASNCSKCGNYSPEHAYDYMPQNILCSCGENYDDVHHDNHGFHINPPSEDDEPQDDSYDGDEPDIDRYEYFEQYYNDSDLEDELEDQEQAIEQAIQEQRDWDSETEENPTELMRRRQIRYMAEIEGEDYYYTYFRYRYK
jgi:hypothetical protein